MLTQKNQTFVHVSQITQQPKTLDLNLTTLTRRQITETPLSQPDIYTSAFYPMLLKIFPTYTIIAALHTAGRAECLVTGLLGTFINVSRKCLVSMRCYLTAFSLPQGNVWHGSQETWHNWDILAGRFVSEFGM